MPSIPTVPAQQRIWLCVHGHRKYSWWHRYCVGHPRGSADWPESFTRLQPGLEGMGSSGSCCAQREGPGAQVQLASSWVQHVQAKEKQCLPACLGQHRHMLLTRYAEKDIPLKFNELSAFKSVYCLGVGHFLPHSKWPRNIFEVSLPFALIICTT